VIPFNRPELVGREREYLAQAVANGHISGDGAFTLRCQNLLEETLGVPRVLLTTSCTHALEMAAFLLELHPGEEVILPSFTFVSTVNAFALRGARPVFVDIRPDTLNLDETELEPLIRRKTRAIVAVHYAGVGCEMDSISDVAERHGLRVVEDNAHGLAGRYKSRCLGTFGAAAALSFHETKNVTCGEGGALIINEPEWVARAEIIREKGTNRSRFLRGEVDKYTWVDLGSSYLPSDLLAAFLLAQLEQIERIQQKRAGISRRYYEAFEGWAHTNGVKLPHVPAHCDSAYHMFYLLLPDLSARDRFIGFLKSRGVHSVFHYIPLHLSPMGQSLGYARGDCPVTEVMSERLVRLPFYYGLTETEQNAVIDAVVAFRS
jgi:dTDP-4-amino-4,6-dideoxygalactose transaminase